MAPQIIQSSKHNGGEMKMSYLPQLNREQIIECQKQSQELWGFGRDLDSRLQMLYKLLDAGFATYSAATNDKGAIVTSLTRYHLTMNLHGKIVKCIGLGDIFTDKHERGKGYASFLIKSTLAQAMAEGYSLCTLFSYIPPTYYESFGFVSMRKTQSFKIPAIALILSVGGEGDSEETSRTCDLKLRKVESKEDMDVLKAVYYDSMKGFELYPERGEDFNILRNDNGPIVDYLVYNSMDAGGTVVAYFTVNMHNRQADVLQLDEVMIGRKHKQLECLVYALIGQHCVNNDKVYLEGWLPAVYPTVINDYRYEREEAIPMVKALNADIGSDVILNSTIGYLDHF